MWRSLQDEGLMKAFEKEFPSGNAPPILTHLLTKLSSQEYASRVFAVTSLGVLRLTTAPDFTQASKHDAIAIQSRTNDEYAVAYIEAHLSEAQTTTICRKDELADVVDRYLLRLLLTQPS